MRKIILAAVFLFFISDANAETIKLKSGKVVTGKIVERTEDYLKLDLLGLPLTYYLDSIESIEGEEITPLVTTEVSPQVIIEPPQTNHSGSYNESRVESQGKPDPRDYSPGINLSEEQIVIDPTRALNALGLKLDKNYDLGVSLRPDESKSINSILLGLFITIVPIALFLWYRTR